MFIHFLLLYDGLEGSNGSHSPQLVAIWAYLMTHGFCDYTVRSFDGESAS